MSIRVREVLIDPSLNGPSGPQMTQNDDFLEPPKILGSSWRARSCGGLAVLIVSMCISILELELDELLVWVSRKLFRALWSGTDSMVLLIQCNTIILY